MTTLRAGSTCTGLGYSYMSQSRSEIRKTVLSSSHAWLPARVEAWIPTELSESSHIRTGALKRFGSDVVVSPNRGQRITFGEIRSHLREAIVSSPPCSNSPIINLRGELFDSADFEFDL